jgi:3-(3-hydroxy-phenyl)propionate hydroxylase
MPPFLGQGLCAGIRDAVNLAWKLDAVEKMGADPRLLDTYGVERKPHVRTIVSFAKSFGLIIGELDAQVAKSRDARLRAELESGQAETVRQKFIPGLATGLLDTDPSGAPAPGAGSLFVQPRVRTADSQPAVLLDDLVGDGFLIACTHAAALEWLDARSRRGWERLQGKWAVIGDDGAFLPPGVLAACEQEGIFRDAMAAQGAGAVVVRPDRYVYGFAADAQTLNRLVRELHDRVFGGA